MNEKKRDQDLFQKGFDQEDRKALRELMGDIKNRELIGDE